MQKLLNFDSWNYTVFYDVSKFWKPVEEFYIFTLRNLKILVKFSIWNTWN